MSAPLTPRARAILAAVEREVSARLEEIERDAADVAPRRVEDRPALLRADPQLLTALELGVAGLSRAEVAAELGVADDAPLLDAVFGTGSPPRARMARAA